MSTGNRPTLRRLDFVVDLLTALFKVVNPVAFLLEFDVNLREPLINSFQFTLSALEIRDLVFRLVGSVLNRVALT